MVPEFSFAQILHRSIFFSSNVSNCELAFHSDYFSLQYSGRRSLSVCESGLGVMMTDWAQLLGVWPSLGFTAWQHPHTSSCPCRAHNPPLPLLTLLQPPPSPTPSPHPRLILHMNNARGLLDRRYQHATACFIHTKVRQISRRRCPDPWSARRPQRHQHQLSVPASSVSLTCMSLQRTTTPVFNGSAGKYLHLILDTPSHPAENKCSSFSCPFYYSTWLLCSCCLFVPFQGGIISTQWIKKDNPSSYFVLLYSLFCIFLLCSVKKELHTSKQPIFFFHINIFLHFWIV